MKIWKNLENSTCNLVRFADDIISLVASYSGRMYGRSGGRKKKGKTDE